MLVHRYPALVPATQPDEALKISPGMWRRILTEPLVPPGSAVLVAGQRPLDEASLLVDLAYDVTALCADADVLFLGRQSCPRADFFPWKLHAAPQLPRYDLAIALWSPSLLQLSPRATGEELARLVAALRPTGRLVVLTTSALEAPTSSTVDVRPAPVEALAAERWWRAVLRGFPGPLSFRTLWDQSPSWLSWMSPSGSPTSPVLAMTLTLDALPQRLDDWLTQFDCPPRMRSPADHTRYRKAG